MIFIFDGRKYNGGTAVEIVRRMEKEASEYEPRSGTIRDYLVWSLEGMADRIPPRELDVSPDLDDETIAFNFLCLLDVFHLGAFDEQPDAAADIAGKEKADR